jgi:pimeloyl-[acyl-carrier protein] methyl ester esterase
VDEIVAGLNDCQLRWLNSSHMLLATHAEAAASIIEDFCERHGEAAGLDIS